MKMETEGEYKTGNLKIEVGKYYRTYGGWKALVIWKTIDNYNCFVIHKPKEADESIPIMHRMSGIAYYFSAADNVPPTYEAHHPADLMEEWDQPNPKLYKEFEIGHNYTGSAGRIYSGFSR